MFQKRRVKKAVLLVQTVSTCFRLATHARYLLGRIALQAKILLLQCALHRLLRQQMWAAYSKTCAKTLSKRSAGKNMK